MFAQVTGVRPRKVRFLNHFLRLSDKRLLTVLIKKNNYNNYVLVLFNHMGAKLGHSPSVIKKNHYQITKELIPIYAQHSTPISEWVRHEHVLFVFILIIFPAVGI